VAAAQVCGTAHQFNPYCRTLQRELKLVTWRNAKLIA
jgi:hypothetical protein